MKDDDKKFAFEQTIKLLTPLMTRSTDSTPESVFDKYFETLYQLIVSKMAEKGI